MKTLPKIVSKDWWKEDTSKSTLPRLNKEKMTMLYDEERLILNTMTPVQMAWTIISLNEKVFQLSKELKSKR